MFTHTHVKLTHQHSSTHTLIIPESHHTTHKRRTHSNEARARAVRDVYDRLLFPSHYNIPLKISRFMEESRILHHLSPTSPPCMYHSCIRVTRLLGIGLLRLSDIEKCSKLALLQMKINFNFRMFDSQTTLLRLGVRQKQSSTVLARQPAAQAAALDPRNALTASSCPFPCMDHVTSRVCLAIAH